MKKTQKGFTLVELLVVIAILAILSTVAVVGYTSFINKAEKQAAETEAAQIADYIEASLIDADVIELGKDAYLVVGKDTDGNVTYTLAGDKEGKTAPTIPTDGIVLTGEMSTLKGTLNVTDDGLVYTSEKDVTVVVLAGVVEKE